MPFCIILLLKFRRYAIVATSFVEAEAVNVVACWEVKVRHGEGAQRAEVVCQQCGA